MSDWIIRMKLLVALAAFVGCIVAANATTNALGVVAWLGITATAGTWLAGLSFVARDWLHEAGGPRWVAAALLLGAGVSAALSPTLALASTVAFLLSEFADWGVYAPLRRRGKARAALASNIFGSVIDSTAFLLLAGFPLSLLGTQVLVKVAASTVVVMGVRLAVLRKPMLAAGGGRHA